ncbi:MAG: CDP-diacylglycerol--glycerol-3-phosphate 3-phosphatidyltransferase [Endomicrobium sp.]|nr:CDP-diacylglycerol--glycerol-3-phosphate 3-phosphatidyltransferase [Endomicrobium sp.]
MMMMNLANRITLIRIFMVPLFILFMELNGICGNILAFIVFCIASITDLLDGRIARKNKTITSLGIFLDPIADKLLISAAFVYFVKIQVLGVSAWMVIIIVARELIMTGLRCIAATKSVVIPADKTGKFKTTLQIISIFIIMMVMILIVNKTFFNFFYTAQNTVKTPYLKMFVIIKKIPFWMTFCVAIVAVYSGVKYVWKYRKLLIEN